MRINLVKNPVGTGPYRFVRHVPGEYVDIERFEDYWGEKPSVKEARFLFCSRGHDPVGQVEGRRSGHYELSISRGQGFEEITQGSRSIKLSEQTIRLLSVLFGTRNPKTPWHDKGVRLAMAYAIDCDAIIKNVLYGIPNHWAFLAPYELGYDPDLKPYPYDPKKARELLAEAGYPKGLTLNFIGRLQEVSHVERSV